MMYRTEYEEILVKEGSAVECLLSTEFCLTHCQPMPVLHALVGGVSVMTRPHLRPLQLAAVGLQTG